MQTNKNQLKFYKESKTMSQVSRKSFRISEFVIQSQLKSFELLNCVSHATSFSL